MIFVSDKMAINLELSEQQITFNEGEANRLCTPVRCVVAGKY